MTGRASSMLRLGVLDLGAGRGAVTWDREWTAEDGDDLEWRAD